MIIADIHCHILPGVDDGANTFRQSYDMMIAAYNSGVRHIIATPHFGGRNIFVPGEKVVELTAALNDAAFQMGMNMKIYPGNEIRCSNDVASALKENSACTLNGGKYILVELPFNGPVNNIIDMVLACGTLGHRLILAHPERHRAVTEDKSIVEFLHSNGVLFQCNADSLRGNNGFRAKKFVHYLLKRDMLSFIGSDAHSVYSRGPQLDDVYELIRKRYGILTAQRVFYENAMSVIENKEIRNQVQK